jgi:hypothetical protein
MNGWMLIFLPLACPNVLGMKTLSILKNKDQKIA